MKQRISLITFLLFLCFLFPPLVNGQDINEILSKMIEANSSANYQGTFTLFINTPFPQVHQYKIVNYGNVQRREELLTDGINRKINFDDGTFLWRFFPNKKLVIKEKSRIRSPIDFPIRDNLELLKKNYVIEVVGKYSIDERDGYKILFKPARNDRPKQTFWIDTITGIPLKIEKYGPDSNLISVSSFSQIKFTLPQKKENFFLKVPPHTNITEVKEKSNLSIEKATSLMGGRVFLPSYLPPGFVLKDIAFRVRGTEKILQVFYTDGLSGLSVFQKHHKPEDDMVDTPFGKVKLRRREGFLSTSGTLNIMNIRSQHVSLTLVGEVVKEEIMKVAESISSEQLKTPINLIKISPTK